MAFKKRVGGAAVRAELGGAEFFWNIKSHVGYGYKNDKYDVLLVQFFLNRVIMCWNESGEGPAVKTLVPDGIFGGQTWNRIKWFQSQVKDDPSMADGMVSPVDGERLLSPNTKQMYSIYALNKGYRRLFPEFWKDLRLDPECPDVLKHYLTVTAITIGPGKGSPYGVPYRGGMNMIMGDGSVKF